jgi:hypothetical protein
MGSPPTVLVTYLPRLESINSQFVCRVRQCQQGCPSPTSHLTRLALQALQAILVRRRFGVETVEAEEGLVFSLIVPSV